MEEKDKKFGIFPDKVANALQNIEKVFGVMFNEEEEIILRNRGGWAYANGKGISYSYCTSSMLDGPSYDYSDEFSFMLKALGFRLENSFGDNGLDSATNWQDTYWTYEWIYKPSVQEIMDEDEIDKLSQPLYDEYEY